MSLEPSVSPRRRMQRRAFLSQSGVGLGSLALSML